MRRCFCSLVMGLCLSLFLLTDVCALMPVGSRHVSGSVVVQQASQLTVALTPVAGITAGVAPAGLVMFVLSINEAAPHDLYTIQPDARNTAPNVLGGVDIILTSPSNDNNVHRVVFSEPFDGYHPDYGFGVLEKAGYQDSIILPTQQNLVQGVYSLGLTVSSWTL